MWVACYPYYRKLAATNINFDPRNLNEHLQSLVMIMFMDSGPVIVRWAQASDWGDVGKILASSPTAFKCVVPVVAANAADEDDGLKGKAEKGAEIG